MKQAKVGILGAGGWGTALSVLLSGKGQDVALWVRRPELARRLSSERENPEYLPGVRIPLGVRVEADLEAALRGCDIVVLTVPSHGLREVARRMAPIAQPGSLFVCGTKGLEAGSLKRPSEVLGEELPPLAKESLVVLSGPNHAEEVAAGVPTATVVACGKLEAAEAAQELFTTPTFRAYTNTDVLGVELGGALKNVIALAAGICDGLGFGDNTKAALMTRGLSEIVRLGSRLGANPLTFSGLSGMGDLIVTCTSGHSRNMRAGRAIGRGVSLEEVLGSSSMVVEGVPTAMAAGILGQRHDVDLPITKKVCDVLFRGEDPRAAVDYLMSRAPKQEILEGCFRMPA